MPAAGVGNPHFGGCFVGDDPQKGQENYFFHGRPCESTLFRTLWRRREAMYRSTTAVAPGLPADL
jgi:hypothetical protein